MNIEEFKQTKKYKTGRKAYKAIFVMLCIYTVLDELAAWVFDSLGYSSPSVLQRVTSAWIALSPIIGLELSRRFFWYLASMKDLYFGTFSTPRSKRINSIILAFIALAALADTLVLRKLSLYSLLPVFSRSITGVILFPLKLIVLIFYAADFFFLIFFPISAAYSFLRGRADGVQQKKVRFAISIAFAVVVSAASLVYFSYFNSVGDIEHADVVSLRQNLNGSYYSKDRSSVYFDDEKIQADPATFIAYPIGSDLTNFAKDAAHVYINGEIADMFDAASFDVHSTGPLYETDKNGVYIDGRPVDGADPASFAVMGTSCYASDKTSVYYICKTNEGYDLVHPIKDVDLHSNTVISPEYLRSGDTIYYHDKTIVNTDPATFKVLEKNYAKDSKNVYFEGRAIYGADPATFIVVKINRGPDAQIADAKDKNRLYSGGQEVY